MVLYTKWVHSDNVPREGVRILVIPFDEEDSDTIDDSLYDEQFDILAPSKGLWKIRKMGLEASIFERNYRRELQEKEHGQEYLNRVAAMALHDQVTLLGVYSRGIGYLDTLAKFCKEIEPGIEFIPPDYEVQES